MNTHGVGSPLSDVPVVLAVEDEPPLLEIYASWLEDDYDVRTAGSGEEALEQFDGDVSVVLLDRLMPGMSGDEVLNELRERDAEVQVAMVTAVEPDFEIITLGVDAYLTKPVKRNTVVETVERLLSRRQYADLEREYYRLVSKRATLQASKTESALSASEEYSRLEERIEGLRDEIDVHRGAIDDEAFVAHVREIERNDTDDV
jgi:DNA-binding response OmpR family regulator